MPQNDFDWDDGSAVILREQPATAIYVNPTGALVIRQQRSWDQDEDTWIVIQRENVRLVALQMLAVLGMSAESFPPDQNEGERSSGAARQRRYRERHRNGRSKQSDATVTPERNAAGTGDGTPPLLRAVGNG
jgi:hypothetical protein